MGLFVVSPQFDPVNSCLLLLENFWIDNIASLWRVHIGDDEVFKTKEMYQTKVDENIYKKRLMKRFIDG